MLLLFDCRRSVAALGCAAALTLASPHWAAAGPQQPPAVEAATPAPCSAQPGYDVLDFWLGEWDVFLPDGTRVGDDRLDKVLGDCAVRETWRDAQGREGWSLFYRIPATGTWRQVWVTESGAVKEKTLVDHQGGARFEGELARRGAAPLLDRTTLTAQGPDRVRQLIEQSEDGGVHWKVVFDGRYERRGARKGAHAGVAGTSTAAAGPASGVAPAAGAARAQAKPLPDPAFAADTLSYLRRLEKLGFAGVVASEGPGGTLFSEGFGLADREANRRWEPTTVSTIGSITKQFTAALVLRLEEQGLLSVQDPMARYLDGVPPDKQGITLHQLLTHSSGIEDLEDADDWDPIGREEFVRRALAAPLSAPPGEHYSYSNAGYSLLGAIVEKLTGQSYETALRERLLVPAGLLDTGYLLPGWDKARLAQGYRDGERWGTVLERPMDADGPFWVLRANGGIHSTAVDMLRWARALLDGRVLSAESRRKLWTPWVDESNGRRESFYGYGWSIRDLPGGVRAVSHNGGNGIHFADLGLVPERGLAIFLQTNVIADFPGTSELLERIGMRLVGGQPYPEVPLVVEVPPDALRALAGAYAGPGDERFDVSADGATLKVLPRGIAAFARLYAPDRDVEHVEQRCRRTARLVAAALRADYGPMHDAYGPSVPLERLQENWEARWKEAAARFGTLLRHEVLGLASAERDRDRVIVRFVYERGERLVAFVWQPGAAGRLLGISLRRFDPAARLFPTGRGLFATFDLVTGLSVPARFDRQPDGAMHLRLGAPGQEATATRR